MIQGFQMQFVFRGHQYRAFVIEVQPNQFEVFVTDPYLISKFGTTHVFAFDEKAEKKYSYVPGRTNEEFQRSIATQLNALLLNKAI